MTEWYDNAQFYEKLYCRVVDWVREGKKIPGLPNYFPKESIEPPWMGYPKYPDELDKLIHDLLGEEMKPTVITSQFDRIGCKHQDKFITWLSAHGYALFCAACLRKFENDT